jgi:squalene-associated FAD-dependent desaturase
MAGPDAPVFPFMDVLRGDRWTVRPNAGRIPFWLLSRRRRVPGTTPTDYLALRRLVHARPSDTVAAAFPDGPLYRRLLEPLAVAALNTPTYRGSARLLGAVIDETLTRGGAACIPLFPRDGLSESFIDPAVALLRAAGVEIRTGYRVAGLTLDGARVRAITGPDGARLLQPTDQVILAVPPNAAASLLPGLTVPDEFQAIVNLHYRVDAAPGEAGFLGLTSGTAEWLFMRPGIVSVTISAANRLVDRSAEDLSALVWPEVAAALDLSADMPRYRVVKEKRATFAATPAQQLRRPVATTSWENCTLAGDWTSTGLPATIEGAIRSGVTAASQLRFAA